MNLLFIFVLSGVLFGSYFYQYTKHTSPCYLCSLQRLGMVGVAIALLMNCRFGIKAQHYGLAILSALVGRVFSLKQISMHTCPDALTYGEPVFGFDLYIWAFIVFTCSIFSCAILTIIYGYTKKKEFPPVWGLFEKLAFWAVTLITATSVLNGVL